MSDLAKKITADLEAQIGPLKEWQKIIVADVARDAEKVEINQELWQQWGEMTDEQRIAFLCGGDRDVVN